MPHKLARHDPAPLPLAEDVPMATAQPVTNRINAMPSEHQLELVESMLAKQTLRLTLPEVLESTFRTEMSRARLQSFVRLGLCAYAAYIGFLITDHYLLGDIFQEILMVKLLIVSPIALATIYAIHKQFVKPELATTLCLTLVAESIVVFYSHSRSELSPFLIFTIPAVLAYGCVVLPLPFVMSVWFTAIVIATSSLALFLRPGWETTLCIYTVLVNANIGLYMLLGTYRIERSERRAFLFNLRERLRADVLTEQNKRLTSLSETDGLTGVGNRRCFDAALERLWQFAAKAGEPLALFVIDIDHFKKLNDTFGHQDGDYCLRAVANCIQAHLIPSALVARYGGEEFVVLLPRVNDLYARSCAEIVRSAVDSLELTANDGSPIALTVSIGTAAMIPNALQRSAALVGAADQALYRAKANGRNRVESAVGQPYVPPEGTLTVAALPLTA